MSACHRNAALASETLYDSTTDLRWQGLALELLRPPPVGLCTASVSDVAWMSVVVNGASRTVLRIGRRSRNVEFLPGSFASYGEHVQSPGCSWRGDVEVVRLSCRLPTSLAAEGATAMVAASALYGRDRTVLALVQSMLHEARAGSPSGPLYAESLSIAVVERLAELTCPERRLVGSQGAPKLSPGRARVVREFVDAHLHDDLRIAQLGALLGLGAGHFRHCFSKTFGMSVHCFVLEERIRRAKQLLGSMRSIAEVALEAGFSSQSHLTQVFAQRVGLSPARVRAQARHAHVPLGGVASRGTAAATRVNP